MTKHASSTNKFIATILAAALCSEPAAAGALSAGSGAPGAGVASAGARVSGLSQNDWTRMIPSSAAMIEEVHGHSAPSGRLIYLIQDAHTNASAQFNTASVIEAVLADRPVTTVYLEAGTGDNSLAVIKQHSNPRFRTQNAKRLVRGALIQGAEYAQLTSEREFGLWGVEDPALYDRALEVYRAASAGRRGLTDYLDRIRVTLNFLKNKSFGRALTELDSARESFDGGSLAPAAYLDVLERLAAHYRIHRPVPAEVRTLSALLRREKRLNMQKVQEELRRAAPDADLTAPNGADSVVRALGGARGRLPEPLRSDFPNLAAYLRYAHSVSALKGSNLIAGLRDLESALYTRLAGARDRELVRMSQAASALDAMARQQLSPDQAGHLRPFRGQEWDLAFLTGITNRRLADLRGDAARIIDWRPEHQATLDAAAEFYRLTRVRDEAFVRNMTTRMDAVSEREAVLVTGGYHAPNLKQIFRRERISYVSVVPKVSGPTDHERYERLLLAQAPRTVIAPVSDPASRQASLPATTDRVQEEASFAMNLRPAAQDAARMSVVAARMGIREEIVDAAPHAARMAVIQPLTREDEQLLTAQMNIDEILKPNADGSIDTGGIVSNEEIIRRLNDRTASAITWLIKYVKARENDYTRASNLYKRAAKKHRKIVKRSQSLSEPDLLIPELTAMARELSRRAAAWQLISDLRYHMADQATDQGEAVAYRASAASDEEKANASLALLTRHLTSHQMSRSRLLTDPIKAGQKKKLMATITAESSNRVDWIKHIAPDLQYLFWPVSQNTPMVNEAVRLFPHHLKLWGATSPTPSYRVTLSPIHAERVVRITFTDATAPDKPPVIKEFRTAGDLWADMDKTTNPFRLLQRILIRMGLASSAMDNVAFNKFLDLQEGGIHLIVHGATPSKSGLGGSQIVAALTVWVLVQGLLGDHLQASLEEFMPWFYWIMDLEQDLGVGGGLQDAMGAMFGWLKVISFTGLQAPQIRRLDVDPGAATNRGLGSTENQEYARLIMNHVHSDTAVFHLEGTQHSAASVLTDLRRRFLRRDPVFFELMNMSRINADHTIRILQERQPGSRNDLGQAVEDELKDAFVRDSYIFRSIHGSLNPVIDRIMEDPKLMQLTGTVSVHVPDPSQPGAWKDKNIARVFVPGAEGNVIFVFYPTLEGWKKNKIEDRLGELGQQLQPLVKPGGGTLQIKNYDGIFSHEYRTHSGQEASSAARMAGLNNFTQRLKGFVQNVGRFKFWHGGRVHEVDPTRLTLGHEPVADPGAAPKNGADVAGNDWILALREAAAGIEAIPLTASNSDSTPIAKVFELDLEWFRPVLSAAGQGKAGQDDGEEVLKNLFYHLALEIRKMAKGKGNPQVAIQVKGAEDLLEIMEQARGQESERELKQHPGDIPIRLIWGPSSSEDLPNAFRNARRVRFAMDHDSSVQAQGSTSTLTLAVQPIRAEDGEDGKVDLPALQALLLAAERIAEIDPVDLDEKSSALTPEAKGRIIQIFSKMRAEAPEWESIKRLLKGAATPDDFKKLAFPAAAHVPVGEYLRVVVMAARMSERSA